MTGEGDCGEIGGMKIGKETEVLGENLEKLITYILVIALQDFKNYISGVV
jgi:hypothetical protein